MIRVAWAPVEAWAMCACVSILVFRVTHAPLAARSEATCVLSCDYVPSERVLGDICKFFVAGFPSSATEDVLRDRVVGETKESLVVRGSEKAVTWRLLALLASFRD